MLAQDNLQTQVACFCMFEIQLAVEPLDVIEGRALLGLPATEVRVQSGSNLSIWIAKVDSSAASAVATRPAGHHVNLYLPQPTARHNAIYVPSLLSQALSAAESATVRVMDRHNAWRTVLEPLGFTPVTTVFEMECDLRRRKVTDIGDSLTLQLERIPPQTSPRLIRIMTETYRDSDDLTDETPNARADLEGYERLSIDPESVTAASWWIVTREQQDVGVMLFGLPDKACIDLIYFGLIPEQRNHGYGTQLLRWALDHFQGAGVKSIGVHVSERNPGARSCYQKCGFRNVSFATLRVRSGTS